MHYSTALSRSARLFRLKPATLQSCLAACDDVGSVCLGVYFWVGLGEGNDKCVGLSDLGTGVPQSPPKISQSLRKLPTLPPTPAPTTLPPTTTSAPTSEPPKLVVSGQQQLVYELVCDNLLLPTNERGMAFSTAFARKHRLFMLKFTSVDACLDACDAHGPTCLGVFFWFGTGEGNTKCVGLDDLGTPVEQSSHLLSQSLRKIGQLPSTLAPIDVVARVDGALLSALDMEVFKPTVKAAGSAFKLSFEGQTGRVPTSAQRQFSTSFAPAAHVFSNNLDFFECAAACAAQPACLGFGIFYGLQPGDATASLCVGLNALGDPAGDRSTIFGFSYSKQLLLG